MNAQYVVTGINITYWYQKPGLLKMGNIKKIDNFISTQVKDHFSK